MGTLISSKVNQWTLLIGGLPMVYAVSNGSFDALPLDSRQTEEVLLTAAQSAFAVAILASLSLSAWEAGILFGLFAFQFAIPNTHIRLGVAVVYLILTAGLLLWQRANLPILMRSAREAAADYARAREQAPT